tara:strand:- start:73 stop:357 length:285 start_codon:yes stop_codon:yes gene_type:complete
MRKRRTITYTLSDGNTITTRELAGKLGITETAARARLNRSDNPDKVFAPYVPGRGKIRVIDRDKNIGTKKNKEHDPTTDEKLWKLVMQMGKKIK